jgi:hypothetical protein
MQCITQACYTPTFLSQLVMRTGLKQQQQSQAQGGSRGGSFHKRSLDAILDGEDEDEADKQDSSSDGVSPQKGARR